MTDTERVALAERLGRAELEMQQAMHGLDGSPAARMRLALARTEYRNTEHAALAGLGARDALALVEAQAAIPREGEVRTRLLRAPDTTLADGPLEVVSP